MRELTQAQAADTEVSAKCSWSAANPASIPQADFWVLAFFG